MRRRDPESGMDRLDGLIGGVRAYVLIAALILAAALPGVFAMPTLDRDEARFSQASAQMLETGDYVVIRYHDDLRNKKPVGVHWLQTAAVAALSSAEAREIWVYRLPSLLGAVLAGWGTLWAGAALFDRRTAFLGAAALSLTLLLTSEAHIAKTDAALAGSMMMLVAALAQMREDHRQWRSRRWLGLLFWGALGAGVLLKGVIAPMIAAFILAGLYLWERRARWMKPLAFWPGLTLFSVLVIPWFAAVQIATEGEFLFEAARVDLGEKLVRGAEGHAAPPGAHLLWLPLMFWPATLLLPAAFALAFVEGRAALRPADPLPEEARRRAEGWRFLLVWAVPAWLVFEIAPTKLVHYTLPVYPAFALMGGAALARWLDGEDGRIVRWGGLALFGLAGLVLAAAAAPPVLAAVRTEAAGDFGPVLSPRIAFDWARDWAGRGVGWWGTLLVAAACGLVAWAVVQSRRLAVLGALAAAALFVGPLFRLVLLPGQSWMLATPAAVSALAEVCALPPGSARAEASPDCVAEAPHTVRAIAFAEPSFVFELAGQVVLPPDSSAGLPPSREEARPAWIINAATEEGAAALNAVIAAAAASDRCVRLARRAALNYSNGDASLLVAAVVEPAGCDDLIAATPSPSGSGAAGPAPAASAPPR